MTDAPIIVTAELAQADQARAETLRRRHYPPERNRVPAHISLFHQLAPSLEQELRTLLRALTATQAPVARMERVFSLGNGVALGLSCPDLLTIRATIADRFAHYLIAQDLVRPRLHVTIQNKVDAATARATLTALGEEFVPGPTTIAALTCWHYRGGPWSLISRHPFRR